MRYNVIFILLTTVIYGDWMYNGNPVCTAPDSQSFPLIVPDGNGGAIISWYDNRNGNFDIYAQRIDANGNIMWKNNGVEICTADSEQWLSSMISDGLKGAIISWADYRNGNFDIYAQRVDSLGNVLWGTNGIPICTAEGDQNYPLICLDGIGNIVFSWYDRRSGDKDVYAQKVDLNGNILWELNGIPICTAESSQSAAPMVSNGSGKIILVWNDYRNGNYDIYGQRIDENGNILWAPNGISICSGDSDQVASVLISDNSGGIILTMVKFISPFTNPDIYAQRVDSLGNVLWGTNGIPICTAEDYQYYSEMIGDGDGGAIIVWEDKRYSDDDIYAQRVSKDGDILWDLDGIPICNAPFDQFDPQITSDNAKGAIVIWTEFPSSFTFKIYAQKVDSLGNLLWPSPGVLVSNSSGFSSQGKIVSDDAGGGIITWHYNYQYLDYTDIYAQRVYANGQVGIKEKDELNIPSNIFIGSLSVKGYEDEKVVVYNIEGIKCGEYYGRNIGYDLKPAVYFMKLRGRFYKIIKIGG